MDPLALPEPDRILDTSGSFCPHPIVETAKAMGELPPGAVLLVLATDPGVESDMPMWCRATRNEHLGTVHEGAVWKSYLRKRSG